MKEANEVWVVYEIFEHTRGIIAVCRTDDDAEYMLNIIKSEGHCKVCDKDKGYLDTKYEHEAYPIIDCHQDNEL